MQLTRKNTLLIFLTFISLLLKINDLSAQLSGNYTLDPQGSGTSNFTSFKMAVDSLTIRGVSGAVTIEVSAGTYSERVSIKPVKGASAKNRITFTSADKDSSKVIITQASATTSANNFTLLLDGADYITVSYITIERSGTNSYGRALEIRGGACHNIFEHNQINASKSSNTNSAGIYNAPNSSLTDSNNVFRHNIIKYGYYGIFYNGASLFAQEPGTQIYGNIFDSIAYCAIDVDYQSALLIHHNKITNTKNGIYTSASRGQQKIFNNYLELNGGDGIYISACQSSSSNISLVYNNFISVLGNTAGAGIYVHNSAYHDVVFNSVLISSSNTTGSALHVNGSVFEPGINLINNIFVNIGGGFVVDAEQNSINSMDYNNLYTTGNFGKFGGSTLKTFADWKSKAGLDANSLSVDPGFKSNRDLHITNKTLIEAAKVYSAVTTDFDGEYRRNKLPDIGADEIPLALYDAGIRSYIYTTQGKCFGTYDVKVKVYNNGDTLMDSVKLTYLLDDVIQSSAFYKVNLKYNKDTVLTLGKVTVTDTLQSIKVYASLPNNFKDTINSNDTVTVTVKSALSGTYSIGQGKDFHTINEAAKYLNYYGVCGKVIFDIEDGTYREKVNIHEIPGSSGINDVTFQSKSKDSTKVIITSQSSEFPDSNYTVKLTGASFVTFQYLAIISTGSNTYGRAVFISGRSDSNVFASNIIKAGFSTSYFSSAVFCDTMPNKGNKIIQNRVKYGYSGISFPGVKNKLDSGNVIIDNIIDSFYREGIYTYYQVAPQITGNTISHCRNILAYGIYAGYSLENYNISYNNIELSAASFSKGIEVNYGEGTVDKRGQVVNNLIRINKGSDIAWGISSIYNNNTYFLFNTVLVKATSAKGYAFYGYSAPTPYIDSNVFVYNNILMNAGGGYTMYNSYDWYIEESDYNNYYVPAGSTKYIYSGTDFSGFSAYQTSTGKDDNSHFIDPKFNNDTLLVPGAARLDKAAMAISFVKDDFYRKTRSNLPDIGAVEFKLSSPRDLGVVAVYSDIKDCGSRNTNLKGVIVNNGTASQSNFSVWAKVTNSKGSTTYRYIYTDTLHSSVSDTLELLDSLDTYSGDTLNVMVYTSLSGDYDRQDDTVKTALVFKGLPEVPKTHATAICSPGVVTLSAKSDADMHVRWYDSYTSANVLSNDTVFTPYITTTDTFFVSIQKYKKATVGPENINFGEGNIYPGSGGSVIFNALSDFILDSVFVYVKDTGIVYVNLYNDLGVKVQTTNVLVRDTGRQAVAVNFFIKPGKYSIDGFGSTVGLFRHFKGVAYPYIVKDVVEIISSDNRSFPKSNYYNFYNWHITVTGCESERVPVIAHVGNHPENIRFLSDSTGAVKTNSGTLTDPDLVCEANTAVYRLTLPTNLNKKDYNKTWEVNGFELNTVNGTSLNISISEEADLIRGTFLKAIFATDSLVDSTLVLKARAINTLTGCDTVLTRYIKISPLPVARFVVFNSCINDTILFINNSTVSHGNIVSYKWKFGDGSISAVENPTHFYNNPGTFTVTLIATSGNGCSDSFQNLVTIYPRAIAAFSMSNACSNAAVGFSNASTISQGKITEYIWDFGDGILSAEVNPVKKYSVPGKYSVKLVAVTENGCRDSFSHQLEIYPVPVAAFNFSGNLCVGSEINFTDKSSISTGSIANYTWNFGDGNSSLDQHPKHAYLKEGTYEATLITLSNNGCTDTVKKLVVINSLPKLTVNSAVKGWNVKFSVSDSSYQSYYWDFGDGKYSTSANPLHSYYPNTGKYNISLTVTNAEGCKKTYDDTVSIFANDIAYHKQPEWINVNVYPNPFSDKTLLEFTLLKASHVNITIYDVSGKAYMFKCIALLPPGEHRYILNPREYGIVSGIYSLKVEADGIPTYKRIVKVD